jgi:predicted ArsR family transcriptional regulator
MPTVARTVARKSSNAPRKSIPVTITENRSTEITPARHRVYAKMAEARIKDEYRETSVSISDWEERGGEVVAVYILHEHYKEIGAEFSTPMMAEHLDELIDLLVAVREKARQEGILR